MTYDPSRWRLSCEIQTPIKEGPTVVFFNSATGLGITTPWDGKTFARGAWTSVDVSQHIPTDANAVFLQGILIITHGMNNEVADLQISLRAPSSNLSMGNYIGQVVEPHLGGSQRSPFASWVPVENGRFHFGWFTPTYGPHPAWSSYGVNLVIQAFTR